MNPMQRMQMEMQQQMLTMMLLMMMSQMMNGGQGQEMGCGPGGMPMGVGQVSGFGGPQGFGGGGFGDYGGPQGHPSPREGGWGNEGHRAPQRHSGGHNSGGSHGVRGAGGTETTYDGARGGNAADKQRNAQIVAEVAREKGVDPVTAVATMLVESGGNATAVGDKGTSFGLFQLHRGGELGNMTQQQANDPRTNAETALSEFARNKGKYSDPGQLAAASQRPANRQAYASKVDEAIPEARRLLGMS